MLAHSSSWHDASLFNSASEFRKCSRTRARADAKKLPWSSVGEGLSFQKSAPTARQECEISWAPQRLPSNHCVENAHPRGEASCVQERNPNQTSAIPLVLPIRAFLDDVKSLKRGDLYKVQGSKQRNLVRSLFATPFNVSTFGREVAVEKFANHLSSDQSLKERSAHALREKATLPLHGKAKVSRGCSHRPVQKTVSTSTRPKRHRRSRPLPMYSLSLARLRERARHRE